MLTELQHYVDTNIIGTRFIATFNNLLGNLEAHAYYDALADVNDILSLDDTHATGVLALRTWLDDQTKWDSLRERLNGICCDYQTQLEVRGFQGNSFTAFHMMGVADLAIEKRQYATALHVVQLANMSFANSPSSQPFLTALGTLQRDMAKQVQL